MTFKYFGYGSNLSGTRLSISCPSLKKYSIAKLKNYCLKFGKYAERWRGGVASIQESCQEDVWGVVWEIDDCHKVELDRQEGVSNGWYRPVEVKVESLTGENLKCRTYQLVDIGGTHPYATPSPQYHNVILKGALENELPDEYVSKLRKIKTNGNTEMTSLMHLVADIKKA